MAGTPAGIRTSSSTDGRTSPGRGCWWTRRAGSTEQAPRLVRDAVARSDRVAERRIAGTGEIGDATTRFLDNWHEAHHVPRVEAHVHHHLGAAGGDQEIAVAVAPGAGDRGALREAGPAAPLVGVGEAFRLTGEDRRVGQPGDVAHPPGRPAAPAPCA